MFGGSPTLQLDMINKSVNTSFALNNKTIINISLSFRDEIGLKYFDGSYIFENLTEYYIYPCATTSVYQPYEITLTKGTYLIELYGASGGSAHSVTNAKRLSNSATISESSILNRGGNALAKVLNSASGAGAYTRGILRLREASKIFLHIGGIGEYLKKSHPLGGYNGGGRGLSDGAYAGGGGGGSTDLRIGKDDPWHRVMVAAGGGGADDGGSDDGSGGCGGELEGQGMWHNGVYKEDHIATQSSGFSFFQGEAAQRSGSKNPNGYVSTEVKTDDRPGAGGGWFGGFARHFGAAGAGGESSFVLHSGAEIPPGNISVYDDEFANDVSMPYAFGVDSEYCFTNFEMFGGIWSGNGLARITLVGEYPIECETVKMNHFKFAAISVVALIEGGL